MTTRFAVYLVPPAQDPVSQLGSAALGYDVRAGKGVQQLAEIRPEWVKKAGQYGFHCTVVEAFGCAPDSFSEIETEVATVCACLAPSSRLELSGGRAVTWDGGSVIALRYDPGATLLALQTLLASRLARFVTESSFERLAQEDSAKSPEPYERARLKLFHTPRGLDTWEPHFTLVEPYTGEDVEGLRSQLGAYFSPYRSLSFGGVTLLRQDGEAPFRVVRDFAAPVLTAYRP